MATVQISDIYNPLTFAPFVDEAQIELNAFIQSGVLVQSPLVSNQASQGGNEGVLTGFKPLGTEEPNYSSDNPSVNSTPSNITKYVQRWRLASQNQSWSTMDIAAELALKDPVGAITSKIGQYWATQNERRLIQSAMGVLADNVANNDGDMVVNLATDDAAPIDPAELVSGDAVLDALQTSGDHKMNYTAIAMHSVVYTSLQKQNLIDFIPNARGEIVIPTYMGMTVVVDDSLPAVAGAERVTYTSILFGAGAFAGGQGRIRNPSEIDREPSAGNGGGEEIIYSRRSEIIHPLGCSFTGGTVAGQSPTQAELGLAGNWTRVWERKNINMAFLQTNG
jgi:hypothetical protein